MVVAVVACLIGLVAVFVALARDEQLDTPVPAGPDWALPAPGDIGRVEFPLAFPGYHPVHVDAHLDAVRAAYADLLAVAPPEVVERARRRAGLRTGQPTTAMSNNGDRAPAGTHADPDDDAEALRVEAALAQLDDAEEPLDRKT